jgi:hypothetical protein
MRVRRKEVTTRLDNETLQRVEELIERFRPFCRGRGTMVRNLVIAAIAGIDLGLIPLLSMGWDLSSKRHDRKRRLTER